jgi:hypothetical protein
MFLVMFRPLLSSNPFPSQRIICILCLAPHLENRLGLQPTLQLTRHLALQAAYAKQLFTFMPFPLTSVISDIPREA